MSVTGGVAIGVAALGLWAGISATAEATLIVYQDESTGALLTDVDQVTAATSNTRPTMSGLVDVEFGTGGVLYGLGSGNDPSLYSIDPVTGVATPIGQTGLGFVIEGDLAYDPITGTLWGAYELATPDLNFFTIDPTTGVATFAFGLPADFADYSAIAFDAAGVLVVLNTQNAADTVITVDKATGLVLSTAPLTDLGNSVNLGGLAGMDFDPVTGNMYVTDNNVKILYTLNTATGELSFVSTSTIGNQLAGLTVIPAAVSIPEPATLALLGLGVAGAAFARRRVRLIH